jgi:hypothetical protein
MRLLGNKKGKSTYSNFKFDIYDFVGDIQGFGIVKKPLLIEGICIAYRHIYG